MKNTINKAFGFDIGKFYEKREEQGVFMTFIKKYFTKEDITYMVDNEGNHKKLELVSRYSYEELQKIIGIKDDSIEAQKLRKKVSSLPKPDLVYMLTLITHVNRDAISEFIELKTLPKYFWNSLLSTAESFGFNCACDDIKITLLSEPRKRFEKMFTITEVEHIIKYEIDYKKCIKKELGLHDV